MENKDEPKEIDIKNRTCYYFDDIVRDRDKDRDIYSAAILLGEKWYETYENILGYNILYKTSTGPKPLHIRFNEIDGFIRVVDGEIR